MATLLLLMFVCLASVSSIDLKHFNFMANIQSPDILLEKFLHKHWEKEEMTLCEKHTEIYLNESKNLRGWAYRSMFYQSL